MTKTKAIFIWLAMFASMMPCLLVFNGNEETLHYNLFSALYCVFLFAVLKCTPIGRKFARAFEKATFVLFGISAEE